MHEIIHEIILASQSVPRKLLLERLQCDFKIQPANIDESPLLNEHPLELVERLSTSKARTVLASLSDSSKQTKNHLIIASDQIAMVDNVIYGKPHNFDNAIEQLTKFSGKTIEFITGLCVINQVGQQEQTIYTKEISKIKLKQLSHAQIKNYLLKDQPYQSAASIKIESLGIALTESISTPDFNAIIGLPLLKLIQILERLDIDILTI